jgi:hypothetical protein
MDRKIEERIRGVGGGRGKDSPVVNILENYFPVINMPGGQLQK